MRYASRFGVAASLLLFIALPAAAVEYGGVGGRPANPISGNDRSASIFVHTIDAGGAVNDGVLVINNTKEAKTLIVDAVDSVASSGGAFACAQRVEEKKDVGAWIALAKNEVTLEPMTNEVVPFSLTVPATADAGEHNGCIVIQEKAASPQDQGSGIKLSFRTGIRVAVQVSGDIIRKLEIVGLEVKPRTSGAFSLNAHVRNEGNVSIDADVRVRTSNLFGGERQEHGGTFPVLRGEQSDFSFDLKRPFWGGWYASTLVVSYDANSEAAIGQNSGKGLTVLEGPTVRFFSLPAPVGMAIELIALVALLAAVWLIVRKAAIRRFIRRAWVAYTVTEGDEIGALAAKHQVSWKLLAAANGLKAPYALKPGSTLKVPPPRPEKPAKG